MSTIALPPLRSTSPDDPRPEIFVGAVVAVLFLVGLLGWAAFARLDAAAMAPGVVSVSGERQTVQSAGPAVISAIRVTEGQRVRRGQILVEFATADTLASERSLATRVIGLQAEIARLEAERMGVATIAPPAAWAAFAPEDKAEAARALAMEQSELAARRTTDQAQRAVLQQRIAQVGDQLTGYRERQISTARQRDLSEQELKTVEQLYAKGYATQTRVLGLKRTTAGLQGDAGAIASESARLRTEAGETRMQMVQIASERAQATAQRQREAQTELQTLLPQWIAAREALARMQLRAPATGTVVGLAIHTIGGVVAQGQTLMEVVPSDRRLVIDARIAASDANDLRPGQKTLLRLSALHGRNVPEIEGRLERVSADSFTDERTGQSYYTATVVAPAAELERVAREGGLAGPIKPGTPAQVMIPLRKRTALQYWLEPITQAMSGALREH